MLLKIMTKLRRSKYRSGSWMLGMLISSFGNIYIRHLAEGFEESNISLPSISFAS